MILRLRQLCKWVHSLSLVMVTHTVKFLVNLQPSVVSQGRNTVRISCPPSHTNFGRWKPLKRWSITLPMTLLFA
jgi:hypothetical protein